MQGKKGGVHKDLVLVANPKVCEKIGTKRYTQEFFFFAHVKTVLIIDLEITSFRLCKF